jgi:hypothetical protein
MTHAHYPLNNRRQTSITHLLLNVLNGTWHKRASQAFLIIVIAHWMEHLFQAAQIFVLAWPRQQALGAVGLVFPELVSSEWMHYAYAGIMLIGLVLLRPAFLGRARLWWNLALVLQVWHHFEHLLLLGQATFHQPLFGAKVPTSILQLLFPRVELHLFYNVVVFIPMVIALWYHTHPPKGEEITPLCSCMRAHPV